MVSRQYGMSTSSYARFSAGCSGTVSDTRLVSPLASVPLYTEKYSATAARASLDIRRARLSHTQTWIPRLPEYTHSRCLNPKSALKPASITFTATVMSGQHFPQMLAAEQHVRTSS